VKFPFEVNLSPASIHAVVSRALKEDIGSGDITTLATVAARARAVALLRLKSDGVIAGLPVLKATFESLDPSTEVALAAEDGERHLAGFELARIRGRARSILSAERVALNFLQHLSGIATLTRRFVDEVAGTGVRIVDTRKTVPGLRRLDKYAVRMGGGFNHRPRLSDMALIKDNHIKAAGGIARAVSRVRRTRPDVIVEVEVGPDTNLTELKGLDIDIVMLDNWPLGRLKRGVAAVRGLPARPAVEVSGNVRLENVRRMAVCGPDFISVGLVTHSSPSLDISLDFLG
jgi:nicotinate-nucleotide pyrophosphorylase (carboxylating)